VIAPRGSAALIALACVLALATAVFSVRAIGWTPEAASAPPGGLLGEDKLEDAHAMVRRLCMGLLKRQLADGSFNPGEDRYETERIAASALACAALAKVQKHGGIDIPELGTRLALGLDYLKKKQIETGPIGYEEPKDRWSQVDATSAAMMAFALTDRREDDEALVRVASALARFARARLRNGWSRGLGVIAANEVMMSGRGSIFAPKDPYVLVDIREIKQMPREGPPQTSDWNVAEVICRVVRGLRKGRDPFPAQLVQAILDEPADWSYPSTDCGAWWLQAWLIARSGAEDARPWFQTLLKVLEEDAVFENDAVKGGWYAHAIGQTAGAILALLEGLAPEVVAPQ
jgi:hypothetical protein